MEAEAFAPSEKALPGMNFLSCVLVYYKPKGDENFDRKNRPIRYRKRLTERQHKVLTFMGSSTEEG